MSRIVAKVWAFYDVPEEERKQFDQLYFDTHVPLAKKIPNLRAMEICRKPKSVLGDPCSYYLIATLLFDNMAALAAGLDSPEGRQSKDNIMSFASRFLTLHIGEVEVTESAPVS